MVKAAPPKVRLGGPGMIGADVYNFYQLISILSGFYVKALDRRDDDAFSGAWDTCSVSIIEQVGLAHACWGKLQTEAQAAGVRPEDTALIKRTLSIVKRFSTIDEQLTEWASLSRWTRVLLRAERQLRTLSERIAVQNPFLKEQIGAMRSAFDARCALLTEVSTLAVKEEQSLNQNYAEPVAL